MIRCNSGSPTSGDNPGSETAIRQIEHRDEVSAEFFEVPFQLGHVTTSRIVLQNTRGQHHFRVVLRLASGPGIDPWRGMVCDGR